MLTWTYNTQRDIKLFSVVSLHMHEDAIQVLFYHSKG